MPASSSVLDLMVQQADSHVATIKNTRDETVEANKRAQAILAKGEQAARAAADDLAAIRRQELTAELQTQQARRKLYTAAGNDPTTGAGTVLDLVSQLHADVTKAVQLADKRRNELVEGRKSGIIGWIKSEFDFEGTGKELAATTDVIRTTDAALGSLSQGLQHGFVLAEKQKEVLTAGTIDAAVRLSAQEANSKARSIALESLKFHVASQDAVKAASADTLSTLHTITTALRMEEQLRQRMAAFSWRKKVWEREWRKDTDEQLGDETHGLYINLSRAERGLPELSPRDLTLAVKQLKTGASKELLIDWNRGQVIAASGGQVVPPIGANPAEAQAALRVLPNNLPDLRNEVKTFLDRIAQEFDLQSTEGAKKVAADPRIDPKNKREAYINQRAKRIVEDQFMRVSPSVDNMFHVGDISAFIQNATGTGLTDLYKLPLTQKVLLPLAQAKTPLDDPAKVIGYASMGVMNGQLTTSEAVTGITQIYQKASQLHQRARTFTYFGIIPPKAGMGYNAVVPGGGVVDLTDSVQVGQYLSRQLSMQNALRRNNSFFPPPINAIEMKN